MIENMLQSSNIEDVILALRSLDIEECKRIFEYKGKHTGRIVKDSDHYRYSVPNILGDGSIMIVFQNYYFHIRNYNKDIYLFEHAMKPEDNPLADKILDFR